MIFRLTLAEELQNYDCTHGVIVRADSEQEARTLAASVAGDEGWLVWGDPSKTSCDALEANGNNKVLLVDFHAG